MNVVYLDASALLRVLFREPGVMVPLRRGVRAVSSRLVEVEAARAIERARLTGYLEDADSARKTKELYGFLERLHLAPISDEVIDLARTPFSMNVRALDAIHVATAQLLSSEIGPLQFWTHDLRQGNAAASRGLDVCGADDR